MKNKINEANNYECVLCETGEGDRHGLQCSKNKPDYKKAYECLMECWDSFDDTQKAILDKELKECGLE